MNPNNKQDDASTDRDSVTDIVRQKIENIYDEEPNAEAEEKSVSKSKSTSKHQKFMQELMNSGKDQNQIQNEWHQYYLSLTDDQKQEVWDEFYASNTAGQAITKKSESEHELTTLKHQVVTSKRFPSKHKKETSHSTVQSIEKKLKAQTAAKGKLKAKHYFQSLLFGVSMGSVVLIIFLFSFFNEIIIAPLIQPSRTSAATPVIIGNGNLTATNVDQVIIPKINVEIPVNYSATSTNESVIENDLESGIVHYPNTVIPGQTGNAAFFGHSSNNIFNSGKYKFAFVLLHTLVKGDTFYLTYNHTIYIYKVISTAIVDPSDVAVLGPVSNQTATATLITCDPPGTSLHRLIVVGAQVSPDVSTDTAPSSSIGTTNAPSAIAGNGPSLWSKFIKSNGGKTSLVVIGVIVVITVLRRSNRRINY